MADIQAGELAVVKCSGERVFVLAVTPQAAAPAAMRDVGLASDVALVRRPVMTEQGIQHLGDMFFLVELESLDAQRKREEAEIAAMREAARAHAERATAQGPVN